MKRIIFPLFSLLMFVNGYSQVKEITIKNIDLQITEKFTVLKNEKKIRQGSYEKYLIFPQKNKNILIEKGEYENNKKVGVWTYFDKKGNISLQYSFDNDSVLIYNGEQMYNQRINRPLLYLGSMNEIIHICNFGLRLSPEAQMLGQSGKVIVDIKLSENGEVIDYVLKNGINKLLDNEAIRVAKLIPQSWLPAINNGEHIKSSYRMPITFVMLGVINKI